MSDEILFDFTNFTDDAVGEHGIPDSLLASWEKRCVSIHEDLAKRRRAGEFPYRDLPYGDVDDIVAYTENARTKFDTFVNVGIGGSSLGAQALFEGACPPFHNEMVNRPNNGMKMYFADNIDPDYLNGILDIVDPRTTLFNIITKSGSTAETMGTFLCVQRLLKDRVGAAWKEHIVATTDQSRGDLRKIADREGLDSFVIPDGVGGRFSVFTPVGLVPAGCAGIDIREFLAGAAEMDQRLQAVEPMENPAYLFALYHFLFTTERRMPISVMMPYSSALYATADWYRQLWAESLGKKYALDGGVVNVGQTPVKALGVTDQHSQVQLYVEGPYDKVFTIMAVGKFNSRCPIDTAYSDYSSLEYLGGRTMNELMDAERLGTVYALTREQRPNMTVTFPGTGAHAIGQYMYALAAATVFSGGLYNINPLDQPGVEAGKVAAYALMGRHGYEDKAGEIRAGLNSNPDKRY